MILLRSKAGIAQRSRIASEPIWRAQSRSGTPALKAAVSERENAPGAYAAADAIGALSADRERASEGLLRIARQNFADAGYRG